MSTMSTKKFIKLTILTVFSFIICKYFSARLSENKRIRRLAHKRNKCWLFGNKFLAISKCRFLNDFFNDRVSTFDDDQVDDFLNIIDLDNHNSTVKYAREEVN
mgnify:CR=1 FL=1